MDDRYIREPFLDLSQCLAPIGLRATWAGSDIDKDLLALGVPAGAVNAARAWIDDVDHRGGLLFPNVFRRTQDVAEFSELFVPGGLAVLGVALAAHQVDRFLDEQRAEIGQEDGIVTMLRERAPLARGFRALGYEPVAVHHGGLSCSWTCNSLQEEVAAATGIVPNEHGFIDTAEQADAVMTYLADPAMAKEDGIWRAWLIVRYDAEPWAFKSTDAGTGVAVDDTQADAPNLPAGAAVCSQDSLINFRLGRHAVDHCAAHRGVSVP